MGKQSVNTRQSWIQNSQPRSWGRRTLIDTSERLAELVRLIQAELPNDRRIALQQLQCFAFHRVNLCGAEEPTAMVQPVPFQPRIGTSQAITAPPVLVEVQVSLLVNERLGSLLPVYFCIGELLTAIEVITKISDAFRILRTWSDAKSRGEVEWRGTAPATVVIQ